MLNSRHHSDQPVPLGPWRLENPLSLDHCLQRLTALEHSLAAASRDDAGAAELAALRRAIEEAQESAASSRTEVEQLRESESRWRSIAENPFDFVVLIDANACFQYVNHTIEGVKEEDLIGKATIFQWTREEDHPAIQEALDQVFQHGKPAYYEAYAPRVGIWFATIMGPVLRDGKVVAASVLARDITQRKEAILALRESEERFRQLAENVDDVFFLIDAAAGRTLYTSPAYEKLWGRSRQELLADMGAWLEGVHPDDRPRVADAYRRMLSHCQGEGWAYEFGHPAEMRVLRPDGSVRWVRSRLFPVRDGTGSLRRVVGVVSDLTERKQAEIELSKAEERYRVLVETLPVIPYIAFPDDQRRTIYISPQIEAKLGFTQEEWLRAPDLWVARIHPEDRDRVLAEAQEFLRNGASLSTRYRLLSRDGEELWFRDDAILLRDAAGVPQRIQGVMLDVSEAEVARVERQRARAMSSWLVQMQEAERRRLARELHDEIGQQLTGLHFLLQSKRESAGAQPTPMDAARELVSDLMAQVRELSLELRPSLLDDLGLVPALINMFERVRKRTGVTVDFEHHGLEERLDGEVETAAYRIVQEALTNVVRHAGVQEVRIRGRCADSSLLLDIHDVGRGFDPDQVGPEHGGLVGMRERLSLLGGTLRIESQPGGGTQLQIVIPAPGSRNGFPQANGENS